MYPSRKASTTQASTPPSHPNLAKNGLGSRLCWARGKAPTSENPRVSWGDRRVSSSAGNGLKKMVSSVSLVMWNGETYRDGPWIRARLSVVSSRRIPSFLRTPGQWMKPTLRRDSPLPSRRIVGTGPIGGHPWGGSPSRQGSGRGQ